MFGRRTKYVVLALWLIVTAAVAPLALRLTDVLDNDSLTALPPGVEAGAAVARAEAAFPGSDALVAVAVYARAAGLTDADRAKVDGDRAAFARYARDGGVQPAIPSEDGKALLLAFPLAGDADAQSKAVGDIKDRLYA